MTNTLLPEAQRYHPNLQAKITDRTAVRWLHSLGFHHKKGVYIDGHERSNVVKYRKVYLRRLEIISIAHGPPPFCNDEATDNTMRPNRKDAVLIFHDEWIYHSKGGCGGKG